ncbi:BPTI/Kunitz-type proteinase inhibitor domain-containing protein [Staphylococcus pragensis]
MHKVCHCQIYLHNFQFKMNTAKCEAQQYGKDKGNKNAYTKI